MADFTKSISDNLTVSGFGFPTYWDAATWDSDTWDITLGTANDVGKNISQTLNCVETVSKMADKAVQNNLTLTGTNTIITLQDGEGWFYEFADHTTNAINRDPVTWTDDTNTTTTWAASSTSATTWGVST